MSHAQHAKRSRERDKATRAIRVLSNPRVPGLIGSLTGEANERRALSVMLERKKLWPHWLLGVYPATKEEDGKGIDLTFATKDAGIIGLQVKSSRGQLAEHARKYPHIPAVVVNRRLRDSTVFLDILDALKAARARYVTT